MYEGRSRVCKKKKNPKHLICHASYSNEPIHEHLNVTNSIKQGNVCNGGKGRRERKAVVGG